MRDRWVYKPDDQVSYGHEESYIKAAQYFDELGGIVEDWGCGCAVFNKYLKRCQYIGLDGSANQYADMVGVDLVTYTSQCDHILLRDVLDHNLEWRSVLANALESFRKRMVIVCFREMGEDTRVVFVNTSPKYPGVPDLRFKEKDITDMLGPWLKRIERIANETMFFVEKA